jgi:hypothetical protein
MMKIQGTVTEVITQLVKEADPANAEYILNDHRFMSDVETAQRFEDKGNTEMVNFMVEGIHKKAQEYSSQFLTPANVKVGDGVTMHLYSDSHAGTVVKVTKTSVTVQRDKSTLDPNFKPDFVVGGFAGHCTNQSDQRYTYEADPNGELVKFNWSKKYSQFRNTKQGRSLTKNRHEFYDYNF